MLALTLYLAFAASTDSEILYEAPATFWDDLPIAQLAVRGRQTQRFLVDSGSNRSVLFPSSDAGIHVTLDLSTRGRRIGSCEFGQVTQAQMSADGQRLMSRLGIAGALGDDFLRTHDVLIDYRHKRVYFGPEIQPSGSQRNPKTLTLDSNGSSPVRLSTNARFSADLVEQDERFFVPATVEPDTACLMALDTGTGESALTTELVSGLKRTGVSKRVAGFQGQTVRAAEYLARIAIADNPPVAVKVLASDLRGPILGGNAFAGRCLFLQFRLAKATYW